MSARMTVRKTGPAWTVYDTRGHFSGYFETWAEAMVWATSLTDRIQYWLAANARYRAR